MIDIVTMCAASIALLTSLPSMSGTFAITSPFVGFVTGNDFPEIDISFFDVFTK